MGIFSSKNHFDVDGRTILLTGGSQGMGRALAKLLARRGANVVIVARSKDKLALALEEISTSAARPTQRFHSISADVTSPEENARVLQEVVTWNNGEAPDIVWANAGSAIPGLFIETPLETLRSQMDINYWAAAYLAHAALKLWLKPDASSKAYATPTTKPNAPRHFIMTSSSIAFVGLAGYSPYAPAKAAMRSLADSLRSELNLYNGARRHDPTSGSPVDLKVHIVCPGTILSEGYEKENESKHPVTKILEEGDPKQTEDEVAAASIKALEKGHFLITTQFLGSAMRAGAMGGSPRDNWFLDTVFSWVVALVWLFIGPDMESKVYKYGKKNGVTIS
ncbi:hypothetical protein MBLNU459_g6857t1 [Dothideomycetes sp. NU459]